MFPSSSNRVDGTLARVGMKYDICSAAMEDPGYIADGSTVALCD